MSSMDPVSVYKMGVSMYMNIYVSVYKMGVSMCVYMSYDAPVHIFVWFGLFGFNASATAVGHIKAVKINDDDEIRFLVEETGVPGGNY